MHLSSLPWHQFGYRTVQPGDEQFHACCTSNFQKKNSQKFTTWRRDLKMENRRFESLYQQTSTYCDVTVTIVIFAKYRKNSQTGFPFQISWENDSERLSFVQKCQLSLVSRPVLFSLFAWRFCFDDIWFCLYHWWRCFKSLFVKMAYIFNFSVVWYKGCHCMWSGQFHKLQYSTEPGGTEYCERIHNVRTRFYWKYKHYGWYREKGQKCTLYSNSLGDIGFTAVKINWVN